MRGLVQGRQLSVRRPEQALSRKKRQAQREAQAQPHQLSVRRRSSVLATFTKPSLAAVNSPSLTTW